MISRASQYVFAALALAVCAFVFAASALIPAPPAVLPLAALICIGCPVLATLQLLGAARRADPEPLAELRRTLAELPETEHPHGF